MLGEEKVSWSAANLRKSGKWIHETAVLVFEYGQWLAESVDLKLNMSTENTLGMKDNPKKTPYVTDTYFELSNRIDPLQQLRSVAQLMS